MDIVGAALPEGVAGLPVPDAVPVLFRRGVIPGVEIVGDLDAVRDRDVLRQFRVHAGDEPVAGDGVLRTERTAEHVCMDAGVGAGTARDGVPCAEQCFHRILDFFHDALRILLDLPPVVVRPEEPKGQ